MRFDIAGRRIEPVVSPPLEDRVIAHRETQRLLDAAAMFSVGHAGIAKLWREGAEDDFVFVGELGCSIFECDGDSCRVSAQALLEGWAADIERRTGAAFSVGPFESGP
jgi:hypothetical protein